MKRGVTDRQNGKVTIADSNREVVAKEIVVKGPSYVTHMMYDEFTC
jgi:hypothetical protein